MRVFSARCLFNSKASNVFDHAVGLDLNCAENGGMYGREDNRLSTRVHNCKAEVRSIQRLAEPDLAQPLKPKDFGGAFGAIELCGRDLVP